MMIRIDHKIVKLFIFTAVFIFLSATAAYAKTKMVSVSVSKLNLRSGPGTKNSVQWEYGKGVPLLVLKTKGSWYKVKDFENDVGWVYRKMVNKKPHLIVKRKKINIRSGPGSKYELIGKAEYGVVFTTLDQKPGWAKVKHEKGLQGWVKRDLVWGW